MSDHIDDILDAWFSGRLDATQRARFDAHIAECAACRAKADELEQDWAALAESLDEVAPSKALRDRIMDNVEPADRFARFAERVARLIDVSVDRAADLLGQIDVDDKWVPGPAPRVQLFHIDGGPSVEDAIVGFISVAAGASFPHHKHLGTEKVLVLQGSFQDSSGTIHRTGELVVQGPGSEHDFTAREGPKLIYLVVVDRGMEMFGVTIGSDDPQI